jgi:hypothetical protein
MALDCHKSGKPRLIGAGSVGIRTPNLCTKPTRHSVVLFDAHGAAMATARIQTHIRRIADNAEQHLHSGSAFGELTHHTHVQSEEPLWQPLPSTLQPPHHSPCTTSPHKPLPSTLLPTHQSTSRVSPAGSNHGPCQNVQALAHPPAGSGQTAREIHYHYYLGSPTSEATRTCGREGSPSCQEARPQYHTQTANACPQQAMHQPHQKASFSYPGSRQPVPRQSIPEHDDLVIDSADKPVGDSACGNQAPVANAAAVAIAEAARMQASLRMLQESSWGKATSPKRTPLKGVRSKKVGKKHTTERQTDAVVSHGMNAFMAFAWEMVGYVSMRAAMSNAMDSVAGLGRMATLVQPLQAPQHQLQQTVLAAPEPSHAAYASTPTAPEKRAVPCKVSTAKVSAQTRRHGNKVQHRLQQCREADSSTHDEALSSARSTAPQSTQKHSSRKGPARASPLLPQSHVLTESASHALPELQDDLEDLETVRDKCCGMGGAEPGLHSALDGAPYVMAKLQLPLSEDEGGSVVGVEGVDVASACQPSLHHVESCSGSHNYVSRGGTDGGSSQTQCTSPGNRLSRRLTCAQGKMHRTGTAHARQVAESSGIPAGNASAVQNREEGPSMRESRREDIEGAAHVRQLTKCAT